MKDLPEIDPMQLKPFITTWIDAFVSATGYHILLTHHPEYYPFVPETVELCLAGHAHGLSKM